VAKVVLDSPGVLAVIGKLVAAAMPQHVAVDQEPEPRSLTGPRNHALIAGYAQRRPALADEDIRARYHPFPMQLAQCSAFPGPNWMHAGCPALGPTDVQLASGEVDVVPTPEDSGQWLGQLPALAAAGFRAVAFDQRGYSSGVRPVEVDAYGPEDLIGDVLAVADALGWSRFDLLGHDWGSAVGWMTAAAFPEWLRTLTVGN
jgi:hypothetical protein